MGAIPRVRRAFRPLTSALIIAAGAVLATAAIPGSAAASPTCRAVTWGSSPAALATMSTQPIHAVRTGIHPFYDRIVVDLAGAGTGRLGFDVRYVTAVHREGSGAVVALRGNADIQIVVRAPAYNIETGKATFQPNRPNDFANLARFPALRQLAFAGSFEGQTTIGLGVRSRLPIRVFVLPGPGTGHRLVIDVYHRW